MPEVNRGNRPLSPFMLGTYYRLQYTSVTSILTRITGNALLVGALLVVWWLLAAAMGPQAFATADYVITSVVGDVVMALSLWALWYHTLAGLRHLYWDSGRGLELEAVKPLAYGVIAGSFLLTVITLLLI